MINFNNGPSVEAITQRLAVIFESADRQIAHETEAFNLRSQSELARDAYRKHRENEIGLRVERELGTISRSASTFQMREMLNSLSKDEIKMRGLLRRAINTLEPATAL